MPKHGKFMQEPNKHLKGCGCLACTKAAVLSTEEFIEKALKIHKNKYTYEFSNYYNTKTNIKITCSKHGIFETKPNYHLLEEVAQNVKRQKVKI